MLLKIFDLCTWCISIKSDSLSYMNFVLLSFCGSFYYNVSISEHVVFDGRMIMNRELEQT
jgi:hypothetical protein